MQKLHISEEQSKQLPRKNPHLINSEQVEKSEFIVVILIRHFKRKGNNHEALNDSIINNEGVRKKAEKIQEYLRPRKFDFFCSPYKRTRETLELIHKGNYNIVTDVSEYLGHSVNRKNHFDEDLLRYDLVSPGKESIEQFKERVLKFFRSLKYDSCVVTHGFCIKTILESLGYDKVNVNPGDCYVIENLKIVHKI